MSECGSEISNWWVPYLVASPPYSAAQIPLVVELLSTVIARKQKKKPFVKESTKNPKRKHFCGTLSINTH